MVENYICRTVMWKLLVLWMTIGVLSEPDDFGNTMLYVRI